MRKLVFTIAFLFYAFVAVASGPAPAPPAPGNATHYLAALRLWAYSFANLPTEVDGKEVYCSDCSLTDPATGGGSGAWVQGINGRWISGFPFGYTLYQNLNANSHKITGLTVGTGSGDSIAFGLNHLNDLATATAAYSMGTHQINGVALGTATGDAVAVQLNHLSDLAMSLGDYNMNSHLFSNLHAAIAPNEALTESNSLDQMAAAAADYPMGSHDLTGMRAPAAGNEGLSEGHDIGDFAQGKGIFTLLANSQQQRGGMYLMPESGGGTLTPDLAQGIIQYITIHDSSNFTIAEPANDSGITTSQGYVWRFRIKNISGGAYSGTITWDSSYSLDGSFSPPANGKQKVCQVTSPGGTPLHLVGPCSGDM